ncbi:redoxin domain-containing protein [Candidatus Poribacteria bacterium]|nr:redoxin domain-containing protein [Candidatus Poribacteria bacterium]
MKITLTVGIALSLLVTSAAAQVRIPAERLEKIFVPTPEQQEKNIEICTQNLIKLGKSIEVYLEVNGDYPEWLSDLYHPKYLPEPDVLTCPSDRMGGRAGFARNIDPKMPVSYGYQFRSQHRERIQENRTLYGDGVPLVRCRHHPNQDFHCLNLSYSYKISRSWSIWEAVPEQLYDSPEEAIAAMEIGLQQQPDNERLCYYVYPALARLYIETGRADKVDGVVALFKSSINTDYPRYYMTLARLLEMTDQDAELLQVFKELAEQDPNDRSVHRKLAEIYQKLGDSESAEEHRLKAESVLALLGKPVPGFSAIDLDGKPISLEQYRGKVVLLDFRATWSSQCLEDTPNVKKVYDAYHDKGFDIIGISLDNDEKMLREQLKKHEIPWRQIYSGKRWQSPIPQQYGIRNIPQGWLIDRDGTLISQRANGLLLEHLVSEAVGVEVNLIKLLQSILGNNK